MSVTIRKHDQGFKRLIPAYTASGENPRALLGAFSRLNFRTVSQFAPFFRLLRHKEFFGLLEKFQKDFTMFAQALLQFIQVLLCFDQGSFNGVKYRFGFSYCELWYGT
jgi:hypothetical protein